MTLSIKNILTVAAVVVGTMFIVNRVPQVKSIVG